MSLQMEVQRSEVIEEIKELIEQNSYEEIMLSRNKDNTWCITADSKKFWSAVMTPSQIKKLQEENKSYKKALEKIVNKKYNTLKEVIKASKKALAFYKSE